MNTLDAVKQFHILFNHPVLTVPTIPNSTRCALRVSLLVEEVKELKQAIEDKDIIEIADALADIQYVLNGAIHEFGLAELFPQIFAEVQRSNMSKACVTIDDALATIAKYEPKEGSCHYFAKWIKPELSLDNEEVYIVARDSDKKTLKSINYSPADLSFVKQV